MIEIIQIVKFDEPVHLTKGNIFNNRHLLGQTVVYFRHNIRANKSILYSILVRNSNGVLDAWLTDIDGLQDLKFENCLCANEDLWVRLNKLWEPRLLEISQEEASLEAFDEG